jgi:hypothetical protein
MGAKLISLSFKPSNELPDLGDLTTYLETDFNRQLPGFTVLASDAKWGEASISLLGKDDSGTVIAVFPFVSKQERDLHDVISEGMLAASWLEDNRDEVQRLYGSRGVEATSPLRMILVAPAVATRSRAVARALERAGIEVMEYALFEIDTSDGPVRAVSFDTKAAPASAAPAPPAASAGIRPAPAPVAAAPSLASLAPEVEKPREAPPAPKPEPRFEPPRQPSPVEAFISQMTDTTLKAMSEQILTFLLSRFPSADTVLSPGDRGFTLNVQAAHLATIRLDKNALWLEVGPEKIPTNKIKDPATLERAMNLPSVLEALQSVHG